MQIKTIIGKVKNGRIQLSEEIELPENTTVYVVIPSLKIITKKILDSSLGDDESVGDFEQFTEEDL